jgi:serralysin
MPSSTAILGDVHLGSGDDLFDGKGGKSGAIFGESGNDTLIGGNKKDVLAGGMDKDALSGGKGADRFVFDDVAESAVGAGRDVIKDLSHTQKDKIDLQAIDAITGAADDTFKFIGKQKFHDKAGELRYFKSGKMLIVEGDVNGDSLADFQIAVKGVADLLKGDFIL